MVTMDSGLIPNRHWLQNHQ